MEHRKKNKIALEFKNQSLDTNYLIGYGSENLGYRGSILLNYIDYLNAKGNSDTTINIHLRTIKASFAFTKGW